MTLYLGAALAHPYNGSLLAIACGLALGVLASLFF